jgi:cytochrome c
MGQAHPVTGTRAFDGGRVWYTAMGHTACSYVEPAFLAHLLEGIRWAARVGESGPTR